MPSTSGMVAVRALYPLVSNLTAFSTGDSQLNDSRWSELLYTICHHFCRAEKETGSKQMPTFLLEYVLSIHANTSSHGLTGTPGKDVKPVTKILILEATAFVSSQVNVCVNDRQIVHPNHSHWSRVDSHLLQYLLPVRSQRTPTSNVPSKFYLLQMLWQYSQWVSWE